MGEVFAGRYELIEPIGMGGMGAVWTVHDRSDGRVKAAKILRQSDAASLLRFVREQSVRIAHPHVVTPESWAGMDDRVLFTMPLVAGGSVADLLKERGALPLPWVGVLLDQLLEALEAVHAAGVVHRDVKPANLLLEPTGTGWPHLRLTDFGIAVPVDEPRLTHGPMAVGSPGYMAPEQWHGGDPDPRQDVYAAGRVGLEMLTGVRPEKGSTAVAVDALPEPRDVAERLVAVLARAAAEEPGDRYQDAGSLRAALRELRLLDQPAGDAPVVVPQRLALDATGPAGVSWSAPSGPTDVTAAHGAPTQVGGTLVHGAGATRVDGGTRVDRSGQRAAAAPRRGVSVPGVVLLLLGLVAVVAGLYLLLTA